MSAISRKWIIAGVLLLTVVVLVAGTWLIAQLFFSPAWGLPGSMMGGSWFGNSPFGSRNYTSIGEQIYYTGTSQSGPPITFQMTNGDGMSMMRGGMACVNCHGVNGQGGTLNMMMMGTVQVPNIQYKHLTETGPTSGVNEPLYTDQTLKRAITEGVDPNGKPLVWPMPKWNMTDEQLNDLIAFLKTLH